MGERVRVVLVSVTGFNSMDTPILDSKRLHYRPITLDDLAFIYELFSRRETNEYSEDSSIESMDEALELYRKYLEPGGTGYFRVIIENVSGEPIGTIGLYMYSKKHKRAEIGYDLMKEYWGNGYITEAVKTLLDYGFNELDLVRIEATVDSENGASIRVLEKNGFQHEGIRRKRFHYNGKWHDEELYAKLKTDS